MALANSYSKKHFRLALIVNISFDAKITNTYSRSKNLPTNFEDVFNQEVTHKINKNIDEIRVAAALHERLHKRPLELVELSNGIQVPADAEYAMEARITLSRDDEGPYVDITGTVDEVRQENVIEYDVLHHS